MRRLLMLISSAFVTLVGCFQEAELDERREVNPGIVGVDSGQDTEPGNADKPTEDNSIKAEVGVGKKGGYEPGIIATPLNARWRAEEKLDYAMVTHALNLYKATNGEGPKSHEEFMKRIIKENMIKLPELPEGHTYVYDPETAKLMVEHPE